MLGGGSCESRKNTSKPSAFEVSSKRRKGFPSETHVKRGDRVVGGRKELLEKLGRNDPCPCGSRRRFQALLHAERGIRWLWYEVPLTDAQRGELDRRLAAHEPDPNDVVSWEDVDASINTRMGR